jgi:hypothetical protein
MILPPEIGGTLNRPLMGAIDQVPPLFWEVLCFSSRIVTK